MYGLSRDAGPAVRPAIPAIPLSVTSRLEEDSALNCMPCHMQPIMHEQLLGRDWMPSRDDRVTSTEEGQPPSVGTVGHKMALPDLELAGDVKKQEPVETQSERVDINTQTG